ncbi:MAG: response regulator [Ardenticatenaceae bacterium]|nr:response regulator [Ardenticatenaceae bacterium]MCB9443869.1 response regulator [Ardenticatenaceae bacterium]
MTQLLIVSDSYNLRVSLARVLQHAGCSTHVVSPGEMPQILNIKSFDLLIFELRAPYESGLKLLVSIRSLYKLPVIVLSSTTYPEVRQRALMHGASAYLLKPAEPEMIIQCVRQTLGRQKSDHPVSQLPQWQSYPNIDIPPL